MTADATGHQERRGSTEVGTENSCERTGARTTRKWGGGLLVAKVAVLGTLFGVAGALETQPTALDIVQWLVTGSTMDRTEADRIEQALEVEPTLRCERIKLLAYHRKYFRTDANAWWRHARWIIQNHPEWAVGAVSALISPPRRESSYYREARNLWLGHIEGAYRDNPAVLENAVHFFSIHEPELAVTAMTRCIDLMPPDAPAFSRLARRCKVLIWADDEPFAERAARLVEHLEKVFPRLSTSDRRHVRSHLATLSLLAMDLAKAKEHATIALAGKNEEPRWNVGNVQHRCALVLGHVALLEGDVNGAEGYLLKAVEDVDGQILSSFGPDMWLARELLRAGHRSAVLEYLRICRASWRSGQTTVDGWIQIVRSGGTPDFGSNLFVP